MSATTLSNRPSPLQLRDELESMVLKELLGPGVSRKKSSSRSEPGTMSVCWHRTNGPNTTPIGIR